MAVNIHITIIELNALHTKRQNLFQELDAVIHLLMEAKHWGLRKSRNATSLNSRFKSLDTLKVKIISVTFRRVKTSYDADNRPLLVMRSNLWASGYDVDGTDQTSLGQFSGRVQQTYKHSVPRFFVPEHGTMFTLALVRFPPT